MERKDIPPVAAGSGRVLTGSYLDWAAILGGAVVAAAIIALMGAFGAALGLASVSIDGASGSLGLWAFVTGAYVVLSLALSYLAGGYVAGRMRRRVDEIGRDETAARDGINGLVVWALGVLLSTVMAAGAAGQLTRAAGSVVEGAGAAVGGAAQGLAQGVAHGVAQGVTGDGGNDLLGYVNMMLMRPTLSGAGAGATSAGRTSATASPDEQGLAAGMVPGQTAAGGGDLGADTATVLGNVLRTGEIAEEDRAFLISAVAARSGLDRAEVEERVNEAVSAMQTARAEAMETAHDMAETARISAVLTAFLLTASALIAAAAAVGGAVRGGRHRDEGRLYGGFAFRL